MISEIDIVNGYFWILGRIPSAGEVLHYRSCYGEIFADCTIDFQNSLYSSPEFRNRRFHIARSARSEPVDLSRQRTVFVHIEKCGGTTLHTMLAAQFPEHLVCPERFDGLPDLTFNELASFDLFSGHFDLAYCKSIPGNDVRIITMLRDPKARLLSLFYFWKAHLPHSGRDYWSLMPLARESTAEEFFSHPLVLHHPSIFNGIAGQLTRTVIGTHGKEEVPVIDPDNLLFRSPEKALQSAWVNLQGLTTFGMVEHYEMSRLLFNRCLNLNMPGITPQQVFDDLILKQEDMTNVVRKPMTDRLDKLLSALTEIDRPLYDRALELFNKRIDILRLLPDQEVTFSTAVGF